jgi:hypothetical protein
MPTSIELLQRRSGRVVRAALLEEAEIDFSAQQTQWSAWMGCYRRLGEQGDAKWDWQTLLDAERSFSPQTTCYAIVANGLYQGLMITGANEPSNLTQGLAGRLLYVNYLASAPWNRSDFRTRRAKSPPVKLSGVGLFFILYAIQISRAYGLEGRIGLHALEGAIEFYVRACHFTFIGSQPIRPDPPYPWLELPAISASYLSRKAKEA